MIQISYATAKDYFNKLETRYYAIIALPMILMAVTFLKNYADRTIRFSPEEFSYWYVGLFCFVLSAVIVFFISFRRAMKKMRQQEKLRTKTDGYAKGILLFNLKLQVVAFCLSVVFMLFPDGFVGFCYVVVLVFASSVRPNVHAIKRVLKLSKEDYKLLLDGEVVSED